jgi:hypothetical protein
MLRKLLSLATGVAFTWLAALPAAADTYEVAGIDPQRGPYTGQLEINEQADGSFEAVRDLTFQDGSTQVLRGTLEERGDALRGVICGTSGARGRLDGEAPPSALITVKIDEDAGTIEGSTVGSRGLGRFLGQAVRPDDDDDDDDASGDNSGNPDPNDPNANPDPNDPNAGGTTTQPDPSTPPVVTQSPVGTFEGRPLYDYDPAIGIEDPSAAYRVREDSGWNSNGPEFKDLIDAFVADPKLEQLEALVLGYWGDEGENFAEPLGAAAAAGKLENLKALFVGDIDQDEAEISWIMNADIGPILAGTPQLEYLHVRGGSYLGFSGGHELKHLKEVWIESGGTPGSAIKELGAMKLPALERAELWLGTDEYGGDATVADVAGWLDGSNVPALKYLGLMNSDISDAIAKAAVNAPILDQLETLDLSMGTLSDEGGNALLASDRVKQLKNLWLSHNYMSDAVADALEALSPVKVNAGDRMFDPAWPDDRYVAVGE